MSKKRPIHEEEEEQVDADDDAASSSSSSIDEHDKRMNDEEEDEIMLQDKEHQTSFLDSFYGLALPSPQERAQAAHDLLQHVLINTETSNAQDALYTLTRLIKGLCSGRAAARQGYASALTTFLKIVASNNSSCKNIMSMQDLQREYYASSSQQQQNQESSSSEAFVRSLLLQMTDPNRQTGNHKNKFGTKTKGSEERDLYFGRIFGILSVIRSGSLLVSLQEQQEVNDDTELQVVVVAGYAQDLVDLYQHKKWMREPATQGILTLLNSLYYKSQKAKMVVDHVVRHVIVPKLLLLSSQEEEGSTGDRLAVLLRQYSPEQIAIALTIQSNAEWHDEALPFPLDKAILSSETMPCLMEALSSTSSVVHPRTHLVWDVIWSYLTTTTEQVVNKDDAFVDGKNKYPEQRVLRQTKLVGNETARNVLVALFRTIVVQSLLGIMEEQGSSSTTKTISHERRALALTLVKILMGGEYPSSTCNNRLVTIVLEPDLLETEILCPSVVQRLFLDVICASGGVGKTSSKGSSSSSSQQHMIKPLALHVLESVVNDDGQEDPMFFTRRLACVKSFLQCEPRFDGRTKTRTVSNLLLLDDAFTFVEATTISNICDMWTDYVDFLEKQIVSLGIKEEEDAATAEASRPNRSYEALGYVDLLYNMVKQIIRMQPGKEDKNKSLEAFKSTIAQRVIGFLMASAFFDCSELSLPAMDTAEKNSNKKKKKKDKKRGQAELHPTVLGGVRIKQIVASCTPEDGNHTSVPYSVRVVLSSRFFSVLADYISVIFPHSRASSDTTANGTKHGKDARILEILTDICRGWTSMEENGASRFTVSPEGEDEGRMKELELAKSLVLDFQSLSRNNARAEDDEDVSTRAQRKCASGSALLMSTLYLHLLNCGRPENLIDEDDDPDADDDDNDAEILELISDLSDATKSLLGQKESEEEENPLLALAELCANILSSPFASGTQSRGASSKIVREAVKSAWTGGLAAAAARAPDAEDTPTLLDDDVMNLLLSAVGAPEDDDEAENDINELDDEMDVDDSEDDDAESKEDEKAVFSAAAAQALGIDDESEDVDMAETEEAQHGNNDGSEEEDLELDPTQLESLLLQDSDADLSGDSDGELEHHAGADAALARLIKLKQDARKAGQQARERLELSNQLRCVMLLDTLFSALANTAASLMRSDVILKALIPLLRSRRSLEKSLAAPSKLEKKGPGTETEKRALLDRLTSLLLKSKICKIRLGSVPCSDDSVEIALYASQLASRILAEMKKSDEAEHSSCCSAALIMTLRSVSDPEKMIAAASDVYGDAVKEWSCKRTTRLNTSLFEDLIQQAPSLAQASLTMPLATSTTEARSPFLKSEAFRLLASLYATSSAQQQQNDAAELLVNLGISALQECGEHVVHGVIEALQDADMKKSKRIRNVLKATEKVIAFANKASNDATKLLWRSQQLTTTDLFAHLDSLKESTTSHGIKNACEKLSNELVSTTNNMESSTTTAAPHEAEEKEHFVMDKTPKEKSSSKKKKKKKQRKGKKKY